MPRSVSVTLPALHPSTRPLRVLVATVLVLSAVLISSTSPGSVLAADTYDNPLLPAVPGSGVVESCADPDTIYAHDGFWYTYCTTDPLNSADRNANGDLNFHKIPTLRSADLVTWTYVGDAFAEPPEWAEPTAGMWAPEIERIGDTYYLFYTITDVDTDVSGRACPSDSAIGYATSELPTGPWTDSGGPLIAPRHANACDFFWTYDPEVIEDQAGTYHIYYGSYFGGISVRDLLIDEETGALTAPEQSATQITIANRYEGSEVVYRDGFYYLFVSATNCCNGALTGYSVFVGRSDKPTGPFVDATGASFLAGRVGGTPVLSMNGNRWVGLGHNSVFVDFAGQWWTTYHAVDRFDPYFANAGTFTKRPLLLDPIDWVAGWPQVRGGLWASDEPMPAPAAQPGGETAYVPTLAEWDDLGRKVRGLSEDFDGTELSDRWEWVRQPSDTQWELDDGVLRFDTQAADLHTGSNNASVLTGSLPGQDWIVEAKVRLNLPAEGCCFNFTQAGIVVYDSDDAYLKLVHFSLWETRQTEFAKEVPPAPGLPSYGNTVVGPPGEWTWFRIAKTTVHGEEQYGAYTSDDGVTWVRGGVWTHDLGSDARVGLVSMGGSGFTAEFDYVHVYRPEGWPNRR